MKGRCCKRSTDRTLGFVRSQDQNRCSNIAPVVPDTLLQQVRKFIRFFVDELKLLHVNAIINVFLADELKLVPHVHCTTCVMFVRGVSFCSPFYK